jgi:hypothetical protein
MHALQLTLSPQWEDFKIGMLGWGHITALVMTLRRADAQEAMWTTGIKLIQMLFSSKFRVA